MWAACMADLPGPPGPGWTETTEDSECGKALRLAWEVQLGRNVAWDEVGRLSRAIRGNETDLAQFNLTLTQVLTDMRAGKQKKKLQ